MADKNNYKKIVLIFGMIWVFVFTAHTTNAATTIKNLTKGVSSLGLQAYYSLDGNSVSISNIAFDGTVTDNSGNARSLSLTGGDWHEETSRVTGKLGQALYFNGGNTADAGDVVEPSSITVSMWVKPAASQDAYDKFIMKGDGATAPYGSYKMEYDNTDYTTINWHVGFTDNTGNIVSINPIVPNVWNHIVGTYDGTTIRAYLNGVEQGGSSSPAKTIKYDTAPLTIGSGDGVEHVESNIDEVRIYNRALSSAEVLRLYQSSLAKVNRTPNLAVSNLGLVGYWPFDGRYNTWSSDTAGTTVDVSGSGNTGTFMNMDIATASMVGRLGQAMNFDETDDGVNAGSSNTLLPEGQPVTISTWIYPRSMPPALSYGTIVARAVANSGPVLALANNNTIEFYVDGATDLVRVSNDNSIELNKWQHLLLTWDGSTTASNVHMYVDGTEVSYQTTTNGSALVDNSGETFYVGRTSGGTNFFDGLIDELRVYNRELSAGEISALYRFGVPLKINKTNTKKVATGLLGYWPFDGSYVPWTDSTTATAIDASGGGHTGTLTNMNQATSLAIGKAGQALYFDGSNDRVDVADSSVFDLSAAGEYTWSFWLKPTVFGDLKDSFASYDGGGTNFLSISTHSTVNGNYGVCDGCVSVAWANTAGSDYLITHTNDDELELNKWKHVLITYDGALSMASRFVIYINGVDATNTGDVYTLGTITDISPSTTQIGGEPGAHVNGSIDEFRFYNRVLTAGEIRELSRE